MYNRFIANSLASMLEIGVISDKISDNKIPMAAKPNAYQKHVIVNRSKNKDDKINSGYHSSPQLDEIRRPRSAAGGVNFLKPVDHRRLIGQASMPPAATPLTPSTSDPVDKKQLTKSIDSLSLLFLSPAALGGVLDIAASDKEGGSCWSLASTPSSYDTACGGGSGIASSTSSSSSVSASTENLTPAATTAASSTSALETTNFLQLPKMRRRRQRKSSTTTSSVDGNKRSPAEIRRRWGHFDGKRSSNSRSATAAAKISPTLTVDAVDYDDVIDNDDENFRIYALAKRSLSLMPGLEAIKDLRAFHRRSGSNISERSAPILDRPVSKMGVNYKYDKPGLFRKNSEPTFTRKAAASLKQLRKKPLLPLSRGIDFLRRHSFHKVLNLHATKRSLLTKEELEACANSFERLLQNKKCLELFRQFLQLEYSQENLDFYLMCEEYKNVPEWERKGKAVEIYDQYVSPQSMKEVNLDSDTRHAIFSGLDKPSDGLFELAQNKIFALMARDSYQRFVRSDLFGQLKPS